MRYKKIILIFFLVFLTLYAIPNISVFFADQCGSGVSRTAFKIWNTFRSISLIGLPARACPDDRRVANIGQLQRVLELHKGQHGAYPENITEIFSLYKWAFTRGFDPSEYHYQKIGTMYRLSVQLEHGDNPRLKNDLDPTNTVYEVQP